MEHTWAQLLGRVQAGDEHAFTCLWRRHHPSLVRYLEIVGGPNGAEDLAAETWISLVRSLPRFRGGEAGFKALLFTTARSRLVDQARRARVRPLSARSLDERDERPTADDPGARVERAEATQAALDLIARLPPAQAEVVALRVVGGLGNAEVAAVTGKASGAVRVAYSRGLDTLAELVGQGGHVTDPGEPAFR